ncbi:MAG: InlB B-repeat-containing protein [Lachnospiraceae bacterium]|nr:InlB B-repeat-containing protein [Lachnospiraceae bacterium]
MKKIFYLLGCILLSFLFSNAAYAETVVGDKNVLNGETWTITDDTSITGDLIIDSGAMVEIQDGYTLTVIGAVENYGGLRIGSNNSTSSETNFGKLIIGPGAGSASDAYLTNDSMCNVNVGKFSVLEIDGDLNVKNGTICCSNASKTTVTGDVSIDSAATYLDVFSSSSSTITYFTLGGDLIDPYGKFKAELGGSLFFTSGKSHTIETGRNTILGNVKCDSSYPIYVKNFLCIRELMSNAYFVASDSNPINLVKLDTQNFNCKIQGDVVHDDTFTISIGKDKYGSDVGDGSSILEITGDLLVEKGTISTEGNNASEGILNQLIVGKNLRIQSKSGEDYVKGDGRIVLHGTITVKGSIFNNSTTTSYLYGNTEGRMVVYGDFFDFSGNISSNGSDVLYFETNELTHNHLIDIEDETLLGKIGCASSDTIIVEDYFYCKGLASDVKLVAKNGEIYTNFLVTGSNICDITGNLIMPSDSSIPPSVRVGANNGSATATGSSLLKVSGDFIVEKGMILIDGVNSAAGMMNVLEVDGDIRIQERSEDNYIQGSGQFNSVRGSIIIKGNLYINSSSKSSFGGGEGEMTLYGDYYDYSGSTETSTYTAQGYYTTCFASSPSKKHIVSMPSTASLGVLKAAEGEELIIDDSLNIKGLGSDVSLSADNHPVRLVNFATKEYDCVINGDVISSQGLDSNGSLTINGSLIKEDGSLATGTNGNIYVRDDLRIQKLNVDGSYSQSSGRIESFYGKIEVGKDIYVDTVKVCMTYGAYSEIILHGDLHDDSASFIPYDKNGTLKFTAGRHDIYATYVSDTRTTTFYNIEGTDVILDWKNANAPFQFYRISNAASISVDGTATISSLKGYTDYSKILEGSVVTINGDLIQKSGRLELEGSNTTLNVKGDYIMRAPKDAGGYQKSSATFSMSSYAVLNIDGNCDIQTSGTFNLSGGSMTVKGDIHQYTDDGATGKIVGNKNHTTILPGYLSGKQIVSLNNISSKFGTVKLLQTRDHYSFEPDSCWIEIIEPEEIAEEYNISYVLNGGTNHPDNPSSYTEGTETITLKAPTRKDFTFGGWFLDVALTRPISQITSSTTGDITLYAKWIAIPKPEEPKTYTITYMLNGGVNNKKNPKKYTSKSATIKLLDASKKGYTFAGWYSNKKFTKKVTKIASGSSGNLTLYAKWNANTYTIKFNANGGSGTVKPQKATYDKKIKLNANKYKRNGYKFVGWATSKKNAQKGNVAYKNTASVKNLTEKNKATVTLYAVWKKK